MTSTANPFDDPHFVDMYAARAAKMVPAYRDIHRMATVLIDERAPSDARVLVLGAGGGLETTAFAQAQPGWTFDAVDPSEAMLELAARNLGPYAARVRMHRGYIEDAPDGPFAAATSLLTLHFLPRQLRLETAARVRQRLTPGAPFVVAHMSFPQHGSERDLWISRHVANLIAAGIDAADVDKARNAIATEVPVLSPDQDRAILREAGFTDVTEFFTAFTVRGWVCYA
ncbi:class I SAM-dependent methyltransferase [Mycolicibacterium rhodesiae]|uniref:Methyltransferase n=1 Tax=Mycolicibacterium rhodesiae TaxID=36814 RepID=A0A1X0IP82_MYCRH|nr:class I SAM-dependent methyltransferase [Mycolicibacterium rhodesiae]MCV7344274.1 class I SAM-dependent methyltransferase [Mycolicibacterium rhodesiae]ORB50143.1 methyltransferase [Mycolicibacterium rhodesiae]